jgi:DNA repair protein RecO (recombination protein O)
MLHKTRGIVFKTTDYSESSVVVQVFTERFGMQSYLINGVKKPGAKISKNVLQPLFLLDMVVYHKPSVSIQRVSELRPAPVLLQLPYDVLKSSLAIFLNEVLYRAVKIHSEEERLFNYVFHSVELLDRMDTTPSVFHLVFMAGLTHFLGFSPPSPPDRVAALFFDLQDGSYTDGRPVHRFYLEEPLTSAWKELFRSSFETMNTLRWPADLRRGLLARLVDYYRLHIDGFGEIRSLQVLEDVLRN